MFLFRVQGLGLVVLIVCILHPDLIGAFIADVAPQLRTGVNI